MQVSWCLLGALLATSIPANAQINFEANVNVRTFIGSGFRGYLDGTGTETMFYYITDLALAPDGSLVINDRLNYRLRAASRSLSVTTLLGNGADSPASGCGTNFSSRTIGSVAVAPNGDVFFGDEFSIKKMTPDGCVSVVAGQTFGFQDGVGSNARFGGDMELHFDRGGNLYIADPRNHRIRLLSTNGVVSSPLGSGDWVLRDGKGIFSGIPEPRALFVSDTGRIYFADGGSGGVIRVAHSDLTVTTLAGSNTVTGHVDGPADTARFYGISGIAETSDGSLIIADGVNNSVRRLGLDKVVTTLAGSHMNGDYTDGQGSEAKFNRPAEVIIGTDGTILVADSENNCIRQVSWRTFTSEPVSLDAETFMGVTIKGATGDIFRIEATPSLADVNSWAPVDTVLLSRPTELWIDTNSASVRRRFYRAAKVEQE